MLNARDETPFDDQSVGREEDNIRGSDRHRVLNNLVVKLALSKDKL